MEEIEKLKRAKSYIEKLANGINPGTGKRVPSGDTINDVNISRCLFYVSFVLNNLIEERQSASFLAENSPDDEQIGPLLPEEDSIRISEMAKKINKRTRQAGIKRIRQRTIKQWFIEHGMLTLIPQRDGKERAVPTALGTDVGIFEEKREGRYGSYFVLMLLPKAQTFIIDNIDALFAFDRDSRAPESKKSNAGKKWEPYEEELIVKMFNENASKEAMAKALMRSEYAISKRLEKLGLVDEYEEEQF